MEIIACVRIYFGNLTSGAYPAWLTLCIGPEGKYYPDVVYADNYSGACIAAQAKAHFTYNKQQREQAAVANPQ